MAWRKDTLRLSSGQKIGELFLKTKPPLITLGQNVEILYHRDMENMSPFDIAKFWMKVRICDQTKDQHYKKTYIGFCWIWNSVLFDSGYGHYILKGKDYRAHRVAYELAYGRIPLDKVICHKCDNPACVNPLHLFLGTFQENTHDMIRKGRLNRSRGKNKGISFRKETGRWRARYMRNYQNVLIGEFETKEAALEALKRARLSS